MSEELIQYAIYERPSDYPSKYVVRRWRITAGRAESDAEPLAVANDLDKAREAIPPGCTCLPRLPEDDPVIVEVWM